MLNPKNGEKFYKVNEQLKAEIEVHVTHENAGTPDMSKHRHAVLQLANGGYVVYDRLLNKIVDGVYYGDVGFDDALGVAKWYNEGKDTPKDMAPNSDALGLIYTKKGR